MPMSIPGPGPMPGPDSNLNPNLKPAPASNPRNPNFKIKRVIHRPTTRASAARDPSGVQVGPTGLVKTNANGSDDYDALARSVDLPVETYCAGYGFDADARVITLYAEPAGTTGTAGIRRSTDPRSYSFSIASLFVDAPELRFAVRRQCPIVPGFDNEGKACLIIPIDASLEKRTKSPSSKKNSKANKNGPGTSTSTGNPTQNPK